ncbi:conserved hypothetical protein [Hyella patelloides LEGE 07179]|uniref:Uncharacterized protein n=1 Tax=Hyella patelloides LEGE 07179 TaxID=945734 RepID=A0A563VVK8_9CYAN|nr:hypothetical protein [Hyella patelloides]VEP15435.1 conserved hypothetical protein [Hyella patelloides LEGE 07179]
MSWAKLCWDLSFTEKVELSKLLPKINHSYQIVLEWEEYCPREGKTFFLWQPPHSELNGWFDGRPSEILKSYVLQGTITNYSLYSREFNFYVEKITPLTKIFDEVKEVNKSPLPSGLRPSLFGYTSYISWEESRNLLKAQVGSYLYLSGAIPETDLEAIFSLKYGKLYLHYSAYLPPSASETLITRYRLNEKEDRIFKALFDRAEEMHEPEVKNLSEHQVQGAEYW